MQIEAWKQRAIAAKPVAGVLSGAECEDPIRQTVEAGMARAQVLRSGENIVSTIRTEDRASLDLLPQREWLYERIRDIAHSVNDELWRFDINGMNTMEVLRYKPGQQFKWHFDTHSTFRRKITCMINLSDPATYWLGGLALRGAHLEKKRVREQGAATLFPSYIQRRARPPWIGTR